MKILLISPRPPWPAKRGGNQRTALLYDALAEIGDVDLMLLSSDSALTDEQKNRLVNDYNMVARFDLPGRGEKGLWKYISKFSPAVANRLAHQLGNHKLHYSHGGDSSIWFKKQTADKKYDLVVCRYLMQPARTGALDFTPVIVDVDDLDTQKYESRLEAPGLGFFEKIVVCNHLRKFQKVTPEVLRKADHLWFTNGHDVNRINLGEQSTILPNIPYTKQLAKKDVAADSENSVTILSICAMNFDVNERGIDRFLSSIWPQILASVPHTKFILAGSDMSDVHKRKWGKYQNVEVLGFVESLEDVYAECAFTIAPIFEGGGTKIKVAESFMYQRTCVVSSHAHRGYEHILKNDESLFVANSDIEFSDYCIDLLGSPGRRKQMASSGYSLVSENLSYKTFKDIVAETVNRIVRS